MVKSTKRILAFVLVIVMIMTGMDFYFIKNVYAEGTLGDNTFRIYYHEDIDSAANEMYTDVEYMVSTKTLTATDLGYSREGFLLKAWNINRESDGKWAYNVDGQLVWADECPEGGTLYELTAGSPVSKLVNPGVVVHFYGVWGVDYFTIRYHLDESAVASDTVTNVKFGVATKTLTSTELGFSKEGMAFSGWYARREDGRWAYTTDGVNVTWANECPEGGELYTYVEGTTVARTESAGSTVDFYGKWIENYYTIIYHEDIDSAANEMYTDVEYMVSTKTLTATDLGYSREGFLLKAWNINRESDGKWAYNVDGQLVWADECPEGGTLYELTAGSPVSKLVNPGVVVHFYGVWGVDYFTIRYHLDESAVASDTVTNVKFGVATKTLTSTELGFSKEGMAFSGWYARREDGRWAYTTDGVNVTWANECPEGGELYTYVEGTTVARTESAGSTVDFYGKWIENYYTIIYHRDEDSEASELTTRVEYGVATNTLTASELGYSKEGMVFAGWTARREQDGKWAYTNDGVSVTWLSEPTEGYDLYYYSANGQVAKTVLPGNTVHFYGFWIKAELDVTDSLFGANGTDESDDAYAIQRALNFGKNNNEEVTVYIPAGTYYISRVLYIYSNTNLVLSKDTTIVRMYDDKQMLRGAQGSEDLLGGYEQVKNVTVSGGTWDGNVKDTTMMSDLIRFNHCYNITIKDCTIKGYCGRHMVTLAGVNKLLVENVTFQDVYVYTGEDLELYCPYKGEDGEVDYYNSMRTMEALHIDCITEDGQSEGSAFPLDGTICTDVTVKNCNFKNLMSGLGSHALVEGRGDDFIITGNTFTDIQYMCVDAYNYENVNISNNTAENVSCFIMLANSSGTVEGNSVQITTDETEYKGYCGIHCFYSNNVYIQNNNVSNAISNGILVADSYGISCIKNGIENSADNSLVYSRSDNCNAVENTITNGLIGINVTEGKVVIDGNIINNADGHGIGVFNGSEAYIRNNKVTANTGNGINISTSKASVSGNTIKNPGAIGVMLYKCKEYNDYFANNIKSNTIENATTTGIFVDDSISKCVGNNTITKPGVRGINLANGSSVDSIISNTVTNAGEFGINILGSKAVVEENTVDTSVSHGIMIQGNSDADVKKNTVTNAGINGISVNASSARIDNNKVTDAKSVGIMLYKSTNADNTVTNTVIGNEVSGSVGNGIQVDGGAVYAIANNTLNDIGLTPINVIQEANVENIASNTITRAGAFGISVSFSTAKVSGNTIDTTVKHGINIQSNSVADVENNSVVNAGGNGISVNTSTANIINNEVNNPKVAGIYAKSDIGTEDSLIVVSHNTVSGTGGIGIQFDSCSYMEVKNNNVNQTNSYGIQSYSSSEMKISNNTIADATNFGIQCHTSENVEITGNNVKNSTQHGIVAYFSNGVGISKNTVTYSGGKDICANNSSTGYASGNRVSSAGCWTYSDELFPMTDNLGAIETCIVSDIEAVDYTGGEIRPELTVTFGSKVLKCGEDFELVYSNNIEPGDEAIVTVKGIGAYDGTITKNFSIVKKEEPLTVRISADNNTVKVGEYVTLTATATGGSGNYTYSFLVWNTETDEWYRFNKTFKTGNTQTWKSSAGGIRKFYVEVKDGTGKVVRSSAVSVTPVEEVKPLAITATTGNANPAVGESITITATATGGSGNYTYSFLVWNTETNVWYRFNKTFKTGNTQIWKASAGGTRKFYVEVKDDTGKVVRSKAVSVTPVEEVKPLAITAATSNANPAAGESITITATATGGSGNYTYSFLVWNTETDVWYRFNTTFKTGNTQVWKVSAGGIRKFYAEVKDDTGKVVRSSAVSVNIK